VSESVRVAIDFKSPASYLAIAPARALESRLGRPFEWLPLDVPGLAFHPVVGNEDRGARHRRIRAEYLANDLRRYAASRGLELGDLYRKPDTVPASLGLLWLGARSPALASDYVTRAFDRIWRESAPADLAFVERSLGGDAAGFRAWADADGPKQLAELREELGPAAMWSTPTFLVAGDAFIGRAHLPMVEWLATGKAGPAPI